MTRYEALNVLWTAGVEAPPLATAMAKATGAEQDRAGRHRARRGLQPFPAIRRSWSSGT